MTKEIKILKIVKEDILRILGEESHEISLDFIKTEIKVSNPVIFQAIENLKNSGFIKTKEDFLALTKSGRNKAEDILKKHLILENYFKRAAGQKEAHRKAHIMEHYISREVIRNIKELATLKKNDISLSGTSEERESIITDFEFKDSKLLERIISMGIFLGEPIRIISRNSSSIIIRVKNKKFALDKNIAGKIRVSAGGYY